MTTLHPSRAGHARMIARTRRGFVAAAAAGAVAVAFGCDRSTVRALPDIAIADSTDAGQLDFWHRLPGRSAVSNSEGFHGVLLLAEGEDPTTTYEARLGVLRERGWVEAGFAEAGDLAMRRGTLAKAVTHALGIEGGVMMHATGRSPRYATRELVYMSLMGPGTDQQVINGLDYLGVISKAQDYLNLREGKKLGTEEPLPQPGRRREAVPRAIPAPGVGDQPAPPPGASKPVP